MTAEKNREVENQQADVKEFVELLKRLQIMRDQLKVKTA